TASSRRSSSRTLRSATRCLPQPPLRDRRPDPMRYMGRAARMRRHHKRHKRGAALQLVSLMDIFTILVFFLLVNSSEVEVLPNSRAVRLPESIAEARARETVVVLVTEEAVLVQGRPVVRVADVVASDAMIVPELKAALEEQTER